MNTQELAGKNPKYRYGSIEQQIAQYKLLVEQTPAAIAWVDRDMCYLLATKSWLADFELDRADIAGKSHYEVFPETSVEWKHLHSKCLAGLMASACYQEACDLADGTTAWIEWQVHPWYNSAGEIGGLILSNQQVAKCDRQLEMLSQCTAELAVAKKELETFSYSVSHDLRAPLRAVDGFSRAVLESYSDQLDEKGKHYLQRIRAGCDRMGELIDGLLSISRVTCSKMHCTQVDLSAMAQEIAAHLSATEPSRQVEWAIATGLVANGDERLLRVVLENLLNNAWKFTSRRIGACIEFNTILLEDAKTAYFLKDNGAGFNMAYADRLFGAFQRLHSVSEFPGTGIGLAIVQRIIHRHGGRVWAEGALDLGATFYFTL